MIWVFEYLNEAQINELNYLNPLMDFQFDFENRMYYWKTYCAGFKKIYENRELVIDAEFKYADVPIELIDLYPNEEECEDNSPELTDTYDYLLTSIINKTNYWKMNSIRVVPIKDRYITIDLQRLKAFRKGKEMGFRECFKIPCRISNLLSKEIRRIRFFELKQVRQGFICDDWSEARMLCGYLQNSNLFKEEIEKKYRWVSDYLKIYRENHWLDILAIPVTSYLKNYSDDTEMLENIDLNNLMGRELG